MSDEAMNVERVKRFWQVFEDEGIEGAGALVSETFHPDVEFNPLQAGHAGGRTYRGWDGMRAFFDELHEDFEEVTYEPPQFHPVGDDTVVAFSLLVGLARDTAIPLRQDLPLVYEFTEDGLVRSVTAYESPAEALETAQRGHADA
jgi:ketosteroid isomerase-like protein